MGHPTTEWTDDWLRENSAQAASNLRRERRLREITQEQMAEILGVHLTTYNRIEKHPSRRALRIEEIERAATFLGMPIEALLGIQPSTAAA